MAPRQRTTLGQFLTLLEFMERNGDLSKPQLGLQNRLKADCQWNELTQLLNSQDGGVRKTSEKWKKVWIDWKSKTKFKARKHPCGTDGDPNSRKVPNLTPFEKRVLAVMRSTGATVQDAKEDQNIIWSRTLDSSTPQQPTSILTTPMEEYLETDLFDVIETEEASSDSVSIPDSPDHRPENTPSISKIRLSVSSQTPYSRNKTTRTSIRRQYIVPTQSVRHTYTQTSDRTKSEFIDIEFRRLELEEMRLRDLHEREMERIKLDAQRLEVDKEQVRLLRSLTAVAQTWVNCMSRQE